MSELKDAPTTSVPQDVIDEALSSVSAKEVEVNVAVEPAAPPADPLAALTASIDAVKAELAAAKAEAQGHREKLGEVRQLLRQREAELEMSQQMGRETLEKLRDQHERMLRAAADLDNYKKRAKKEQEDAAKFGLEKTLLALLPVLDNLDRALEHSRGPSDFDALKSGLAMTRKLFEDTLGKYGVKGFSALNQPFDPHKHEAMQSVESDLAPNTVVGEMVRGYTMHDRLMRPAMVTVAKPRAKAEASPAPSEEAAAPAVTSGTAAPEASGEAAADAGGTKEEA